jgi:hypothetical protein
MTGHHTKGHFFQTYIGGKVGDYRLVELDTHEVRVVKTFQELYYYFREEVRNNRIILFTIQPPDIQRAYTKKEINGFVEDYISAANWIEDELDRNTVENIRQKYEGQTLYIKQSAPLTEKDLKELRYSFEIDPTIDNHIKTFFSPFHYQPYKN